MEEGAHIVKSDAMHTRASYTVPLHQAPIPDFSENVLSLPILDIFGNAMPVVSHNDTESTNCCRVSNGHTGEKVVDQFTKQVQLGNKLASDKVLPPGYKLVSVPRNGRFFVSAMTSTGLFVTDECFLAQKHCSRIGQLGFESNEPQNLSLSISTAGRLMISTLGFPGPVKNKWQSENAESACDKHVLFLQVNGVLALYCGCGCYGEPLWASGEGAIQPIQCFSVSHLQPVLLPGDPLSSLQLNTLLSDRADDGHYVEGVMQSDGNFVVYRNPSPAPTPLSLIGTHNIADSYVFEVAQDGNVRILGWKSKAWKRLWDNKFHGRPIVPYFLVLRHYGTIEVYEGYGLCEVGEQVWSGTSGRSSKLPVCSPTKMQRKEMCELVTPDVFYFFDGAAQFTVMLASHGESAAQLDKFIQHMSLHNQVACILIVWLKPFEVKQPFFLNGKLVKYLNTFDDAQKNKYYPSIHTTTEAVLQVGKEMLMHYDDMERVFEMWCLNKDKLIGLTSLKHTKKNVVGFAEKSVILADTIMVHKKHIMQFTCFFGEALHTIVEQHIYCEDVAMNFIVANATSDPYAIHIQPKHQESHFTWPGAELSFVRNISNSITLCIRHLERLLGTNFQHNLLTLLRRSF